MATKISALTLTAAVALIGAALVTVSMTAETAARPAACATSATLDSGYGISQPADQACGAQAGTR